MESSQKNAVLHSLSQLCEVRFFRLVFSLSSELVAYKTPCGRRLLGRTRWRNCAAVRQLQK